MRAGSCVVVILVALGLLGGAAAAVPISRPTLVTTLPVLEVLDANGSITAARVQEALGKLDRELARCGEVANWTGDALVWIVTDWHGRATKVQVATTKPSVEKCLVEGLKKLVVPKAQGRATTIARLRLAPAAPPADKIE